MQHLKLEHVQDVLLFKESQLKVCNICYSEENQVLSGLSPV